MGHGKVQSLVCVAMPLTALTRAACALDWVCFDWVQCECLVPSFQACMQVNGGQWRRYQAGTSATTTVHRAMQQVDNSHRTPDWAERKPNPAIPLVPSSNNHQVSAAC